MPMLLVPPTAAAGSHVVFLCLLVRFALDSPLFFLLSFFRLVLANGVVRRGGVAGLCLFRIV